MSLKSEINYHRTKVKKNSYTEELHYAPCEQLYWILHISSSAFFFFPATEICHGILDWKRPLCSVQDIKMFIGRLLARPNNQFPLLI